MDGSLMPPAGGRIRTCVLVVESLQGARGTTEQLEPWAMGPWYQVLSPKSRAPNLLERALCGPSIGVHFGRYFGLFGSDQGAALGREAR